MADDKTRLKDDWLKRKMFERRLEYTSDTQVTIFTGTWNVAAKKPQEEISSWLVPSKKERADIYMVGFQEIVDLNAGNLLVEHKAHEPWLELIKKTLCAENHDFRLIVSKHLVGILLAIFVRADYYDSISDVAWATAGVGVMGVGGNKGGVGVRFNIFSTSVCVVCSHLAAHQNNVQGRNDDFHNVADRLKFELRQESRTVTIRQHDALFWIGDLNYRLDFPEVEEVFDLIEKNDIKALLEKDQLTIERNAGRVFEGFEEGPIKFPPTYKFQPGTDMYEARPDKKKRLPSWCDRILYLGSDIKQKSYMRSNQKMSDHKPVSAMFSLNAKILVKENHQKVYQELVKKLERYTCSHLILYRSWM